MDPHLEYLGLARTRFLTGAASGLGDAAWASMLQDDVLLAAPPTCTQHPYHHPRA